MHNIMFEALALALAFASPNPATLPGDASNSELMNAFRMAESVELYVVMRGLETPIALRVDSLRRLSCRYRIHRSTPQWAELERAMRVASVQIDQTPAYGEIRVGLVFGDETGTLLEVYSGDLPMPDGRVKGYIQRREVAISGSFAQVLHSFADAHRDLADVSQVRPELCGHPLPPGIPLVPPPFHFSDPDLDRDHQSLITQVRAATLSYMRSSMAAHTALGSMRDSPADSAARLRARDAVQQAIGDARRTREALQAYGEFLDGAIRRAPAEEVRLAIENRRLIPEQLRAENDELVNLLAELAGVHDGS